jgi:hypothetical protein
MNNLALTLWRMDQRQAALRLMRAAAEGFARVLGPEHPDTLAARRAIERFQAASGPEADPENDHGPG